jgi:hypothetical protein
MKVNLERHIPFIVVGNNMSALAISFAYNAPYIFVKDEFPYMLKGHLAPWEASKLLGTLFGGKLSKVAHKWNRFGAKHFYWNWMTLLSGIGGLDITGGKCVKITFSDPNVIFLEFSNGSTMKIFYELCFVMTKEGINLRWKNSKYFEKKARVPVYDFWEIFRLEKEQSNIPNLMKGYEKHDKERTFVARKAFFPFAPKYWRWGMTYSFLTAKELENSEVPMGVVKKKFVEIMKKYGMKIVPGRNFEIQHVGRDSKSELMPFFFYPLGAFMYDHNKMIVNFRVDQAIDHLYELWYGSPDNIALEPYTKKVVFMLRSPIKAWIKGKEYKRLLDFKKSTKEREQS